VDEDGNVYVAGITRGDLAGLIGSADGYVRIYSPDNAVLDTTQFGSTEYESVHAIGLDASKNVYVCGETEGELQGPNLGTSGSEDAFVVQLTP
jgi:hypothetical protein